MAAAFHRFPAFASLLIQIVAFGSVQMILRACDMDGAVPATAWMMAAAQGTAAALISRWVGQEIWWTAMHGAFPFSVIAVRQIDLPDWFFLVGFLFFASLYWSTYRTRVPFYPSRLPVWRAFVDDLPGRPLRIVDAGSGTGGLVRHVARKRPDCLCSGVEVAPLPWLVGWLCAAMQGMECRLRWARYETLDFGRFDVVFAYLSPAAMPAFWAKASREMRAGSRLYSFEFAIPGAPDAHRIDIPGVAAPLYRFEMPGNCGAESSKCEIRAEL